MVLMKETGLHDKNGKEIYEGDIVVEPSLDGKRDNISTVEWSKRDMAFECVFKASKLNLASSEFVEVIGNIWENSELIKTVSKDTMRGKYD